MKSCFIPTALLCLFLVAAPILITAPSQVAAQNPAPAPQASAPDDIAQTQTPTAGLTSNPQSVSSPLVRAEHDYASYKVNDDGTVESTYDAALTILDKNAIDSFKQTGVSYSTSAEKLDIIDAYTKKADGRRIDVGKDGYQQEVGSGRDKNQPAFSDQTTMVVLFPDVAAGDTVHWSYKITQTAPIFPGKFSFLSSFPRNQIHDDVDVKLNMPLSLQGKFESFGLTEKVNKEENGRKIIEWTYQNKQEVLSKGSRDKAYDLEKEPGFVVSNFLSYAAIAEAYGARATPKAVVTDAIRKLANGIVAGKTTTHDQAKALYDWEVTNIGYAGNYIGVGAVVPRDLDFVIGNKVGDCKDHATLLQALLMAEGIASSQALIDAGPIYHLPTVPVVAIVNHVINYVPSLDLFLDSTSRMPFGLLPAVLSGKPVLLVDGYKDGMTTPPVKQDTKTSTISSKSTINKDGSIDGMTRVELSGTLAVARHDAFEKLRKDKEKELFDKAVKSEGYEGTLTLTRGDYDDTHFTYWYELKYTLHSAITVGTPGALYLSPHFARSLLATSIANSFQHEMEPEDEFQCYPVKMIENYVIEFPTNIKVLAIPDGVTASNSLQTYKSSYILDGNTVKAMRTLDDTTAGPLCGAEADAAYKETAKKAMPDLKAQIVYK